MFARCKPSKSVTLTTRRRMREPLPQDRLPTARQDVPCLSKLLHQLRNGARRDSDPEVLEVWREHGRQRPFLRSLRALATRSPSSGGNIFLLNQGRWELRFPRPFRFLYYKNAKTPLRYPTVAARQAPSSLSSASSTTCSVSSSTFSCFLVVASSIHQRISSKGRISTQ